MIDAIPLESETITREGLSPVNTPVFVVQEHLTSACHWDFRLETEGGLRAWAVLKDPTMRQRFDEVEVGSEDFRVRALAVWDAGPFDNLSTDEHGRPVPLSRALERGRAEVWLRGEKLRGGYRLLRAEVRGEDEDWLLLKVDALD
jgi:hypothetical protein